MKRFIYIGKRKRGERMHKSIKTWFDIKNIEKGIIELKDGRLCKVVEVYPINFSLKSLSEQESILYGYKNFLNTCDFNMQILVYSKKSNLDTHINKIEENIKLEKDEKLVRLMKGYIDMIKNETLKSALTKRFFIIVSSGEYGKKILKEKAILELNEKVVKIKNSLLKCGNLIKEFDKNNDQLVDIIYAYMNPITSNIQDFKEFSYEYKN